MAFELKYRNLNLRERMTDSRLNLIGDLDPKETTRQEIKQQVIRALINELNLEESMDTKIKFCSGGERKRLSLAVELIALPDILLLDEPTTGLDSSTSLQIISYLKKCTELKRFTVVAVIHQPSFKLFNTFGNVIIQSKNGHNIFNGPPNKIDRYLKEHELNCPKFYNPADFIIDVANGDFGEPILEKLTNFQRRRHKFMINNEINKNEKSKEENNLTIVRGLVPLSEMIMKSSPFYWSHLYFLTMESIKIQLTDTLVIVLKVLNYLMSLVAFHLAFGWENGKYDGCPKYDLIKNFRPSRLHELMEYNKDQADGVMAITGNFYFSLIVVCYGNSAIPAYTVPNELKVFLRQSDNLWYSLPAYFFSRTIADFPIIITYVVVYGSLNWYITGIVASFDRYLLIMICYITASIWSQSFASFVGCIFIDSVSAAVYLTILGAIPVAIVTERIKLYSEDWNIFVWFMAKFSIFPYEFKAMMLSLFGNSRCENQYENLFVNYTLEIKDWLDYNLDVKKGNYTGSEITEQFSNTLLKLINGEYFNNKNLDNQFEFRSMVLNKFEIPNYNITYLLLFVISQMIILKILALALMYYFTRNRIV